MYYLNILIKTPSEQGVETPWSELVSLEFDNKTNTFWSIYMNCAGPLELAVRVSHDDALACDFMDGENKINPFSISTTVI